jgi:hypothetical protein
MAITRDRIKGVARGLLSDVGSAADEARADHVFQGRYLTKNFNHTEIGTNVNLAASPIGRMKYAGAVLAAYITPAVNLAINTSNYVYLTLKRRSGTAAGTVVATVNTAVTALTEFTPTALTVNVNGNTFSAGEVLTLEATKYLSGTTSTASMTEATSQCEFGVQLEEGY